MGKLGVAAFAAEAALWVTGAALIASAAGMHWSMDLPSVNLAALTGSQASATASAGVSAHAPSLAPGASPTVSPVVLKFLAIVARPDFQFAAKFTNDQTFTYNGTAMDDSQSGTMSYKGGDDTDSHRETLNGAVTTYDYVHLGQTTYERKNGGAWTRSVRPATDIAGDRLLFTPTAAFVDRGLETKNGAQLHRLEIADQGAFAKSMMKTSVGATAAQVTLTVWVQDDGTPADIELSGWVQVPVSGVSTRVTDIEEFRITSTSGVTITAPI